MIDDLNKRIIEVMVRSEHSKSTFAKVLDVSLPIITHITTGRNKPGLDIIQKLLTNFEQISPDWLLLGIGNMYREEAKRYDFTSVIANVQSLSTEIEAIKSVQSSVIQYHKILFDEVRHLAEMDILLEKGGDQLKGIEDKLAAVKNELLSL
ncbi:MAG: hypothetical protein V4651_14570 [Bacteroidota bacterium]